MRRPLLDLRRAQKKTVVAQVMRSQVKRMIAGSPSMQFRPRTSSAQWMPRCRDFRLGGWVDTKYVYTTTYDDALAPRRCASPV